MKRRPTKPTKKPPPPMDRKAVFLEAFRAQAANISQACRAAGINRSTFYDWRNDDAAFAQAVSDEEESLLDLSESALIRAVAKGDVQAIKFILRTKGRSRGYVERHEITGEDGAPVALTIQAARSILAADGGS